MHNLLQNYKKACEELAQAFLKELYPNEPQYYEDIYWIGKAVGEVLSWGDWYVDMHNIANYFKYNFTPDEFFDWYNQYVEDDGVNMKSFKLLDNKK